jgi:hypothetical protein
MSLSSRRRRPRSAPRSRFVASTLSVRGCPRLEFALHALFAGCAVEECVVSTLLRAGCPTRKCVVCTPRARLPEHRVGPRPPPASQSCLHDRPPALGPPSLELARRGPVARRTRVVRVRSAVSCRTNGPLRSFSRLPEILEARSPCSCLRDERVAVRSASRKVAFAIRISRTAEHRAVVPHDALAARCGVVIAGCPSMRAPRNGRAPKFPPQLEERLLGRPNIRRGCPVARASAWLRKVARAKP